jgi:putative lipoprotein (rSAM/lipoprotein system)
MKKPIIKSFDKIILLLLSFTGIFYACPKYGMPVDEYEINGVITDEHKKPINNICVIKQGYHKPDTLYTDLQGKYNLEFYDEIGNRQIRLKIEDIDSIENGGYFKTQEIEVKFTDADLVKKRRSSRKPNKYSKNLNIELSKEEIFIPLYGTGMAPFQP